MKTKIARFITTVGSLATMIVAASANSRIG
jgi:hypothetical protein